MNDSDTHPPRDDRRLLLELIHDAHVRLEASSATLDTKAGVLLGFASASVALAMVQGLPTCRTALSLGITATWSALLLVSVFALAAALRPVPWTEVPSPDVVFDKYSTLTFDEIYAGLGRDFSEAWSENRCIHEKKARCVRIALLSLMAGLAVFAIDILAARPMVNC